MQMFLDKNHFNPDCLNIFLLKMGSVLLMDETGEPGKNHRPAAGH